MLYNVKKIAARLAEYGSDRRAAISPMMVLMLIPLCGIMALAGEVSFWFMTQRALQNAADSAAVAAALSDDETEDANGLPQFENEALAVASRYGFATNVNNVTITTQREAPCTSPTLPVCYRVTAERAVPLYLTQLVGYQGDADLGERFGKVVAAVGVAQPSGNDKNFCLISLDQGSGSGITFNGNQVKLPGCDFLSNNSITCNGGSPDTNPVADSTWYAGSSSSTNCPKSGNDHPNQPVYADTFGYLNNTPSPVPTNNCGTRASDYLHANNGNQAKNQTTQHINAAWTGTKVICGDAWLMLSNGTGNPATVTLNGTATDGSEDRKLVIFNGKLNLNGGSLSTSGTAGLTVILAKGAPADTAAAPGVAGSGTLDIAAPNSGTASGAAIIVDNEYTSGSVSLAGSGANFKITGLVYSPTVPVVLSGAVNKSTSGTSCVAFIAKSFTSNGNVQVFDNPTAECRQAGLNNLPQLPTERAGLVQ